MTLNGVMALILRYFTEFAYDVVIKQLSRFQNLRLIVYDRINVLIRSAQLFSDYLGKQNLITRFDWRMCLGIVEIRKSVQWACTRVVITGGKMFYFRLGCSRLIEKWSEVRKTSYGAVQENAAGNDTVPISLWRDGCMCFIGSRVLLL